MPNDRPIAQEHIDSLVLMGHIEKTVDVKIADHVARLQIEREKHIAVYYGAKKEIEDKLAELEELIRSGFPDGDPEGHCAVHKGYIKDAKDSEELVKTAKKRAVDLGTGGLLLLIGYALLDYVKAKLGVK